MIATRNRNGIPPSNNATSLWLLMNMYVCIVYILNKLREDYTDYDPLYSFANLKPVYKNPYLFTLVLLWRQLITTNLCIWSFASKNSLFCANWRYDWCCHQWPMMLTSGIGSDQKCLLSIKSKENGSIRVKGTDFVPHDVCGNSQFWGDWRYAVSFLWNISSYVNLILHYFKRLYPFIWNA